MNVLSMYYVCMCDGWTHRWMHGFEGWMISHGRNGPHGVHLFACPWTLGSLPPSGYRERTVVNAGVHVDISLQGPAFSSSGQKEVEQFDHIIIQCFEEPPHGFAQRPQHLQPPTNSAQFPHTPADAWSLHICLYTSHPDGCDGPPFKGSDCLGRGWEFPTASVCSSPESFPCPSLIYKA